MQAIWVTGGKGFIGRHLARLIADQGHAVFGIGHGLWSEQQRQVWQYRQWFNADIEAANLSLLARESGMPQAIFHLAGGSSVGASLQSPHEDFLRTVVTTARLLEWVRLSAPETAIVVASSAAVYGAGHAGAIREDVALAPFSPYGAHKAMMEDLCRCYAENFGLRIAIVRLFSVYGAGLEKQLIWDLCSKLAVARGEPVTLGGSGAEVRDWLHVSDAARVLWLARERSGPDSPVFNGGTQIGTRISDVAGIVAAAWGGSPRILFSGQARKGDPVQLVANIDVTRSIGFQPRVAVADGIARTVAWFKHERGPSSNT